MDNIKPEHVPFRDSEILEKTLKAQEFRKQLNEYRLNLVTVPDAEIPEKEEIPESLSTPPQSAETPEAVFKPLREVNPLIQHTNVACGQAAAACAINAVTGKKLTSQEFADKYNFSLLQGMNQESEGVKWRDAGDFAPEMWSEIDEKLQQGVPVVMGLNGPEFSPSGRGHIVTVVSTDPESGTVDYMDPADGTIKTTKRENIEKAPAHPDGKFVFLGDKQEGYKGTPVKFKPDETQQEAFIGSVAEYAGLDGEIFYNMLFQESKLNPLAVGTSGETGIGQMMDGTKKEVMREMISQGLLPETTTLGDYENNFLLQAQMSAYYLRKMKDQFGTTARALAAYNAGPGQIQNVIDGKDEVIDTNAQYVGHILRISPEEAKEAILTGKDPEGVDLDRGGTLPAVGGRGNPSIAIMEYYADEINTLDAYNKRKLPNSLKAMAAYMPETASVVFNEYEKASNLVSTNQGLSDALTEGSAAEGGGIDYSSLLTEEDPVADKVKKAAVEFTPEEYWSAFGSRFMNNLTFTLSDRLGITSPDKRDFEILEAAGKDEDSSAFFRAFTNYGPSVLGDIGGLLIGGGIAKLGFKALSKLGASTGIQAFTKAAAMPQALSTKFGKAVAISGRKTIGKNFASGMVAGITYGFPAAASEFNWEYKRALADGASEEDAATAGWSAFAYTMGASALISAALPAIGMPIAAATYGVPPAVKGGIKHMMGPDRVAKFNNSWTGAMYRGLKEASWRGLSATQKMPIVGGMIKAIKELPDQGKDVLLTAGGRFAKFVETQETKALLQKGYRAEVNALDSAVNYKKKQYEFIENTYKKTGDTQQKLVQLKQTLDQEADKLLEGIPLGISKEQYLAATAPDQIFNQALSAQSMNEARTSIKSALIDDTGNHPYVRLLSDIGDESLKSAGLNRNMVETAAANYQKLYKQAFDARVISEEEYAAAREGISAVYKQAKTLPGTSTEKKGGEALKAFREGHDNAIKEVIENYRDAHKIRTSLSGFNSADQFRRLDEARQMLAKRENQAAAQAYQEYKQHIGGIDDLLQAAQDKLRPQSSLGVGQTNPINGTQMQNIMGKHLGDMKRELGAFEERALKLKAHIQEKEAKLGLLSDDEILEIPKGESVTLSQAAGDDATLQRVLDGDLRIERYVRPQDEEMALKGAVNNILKTTQDGMNFNQIQRFEKLRQSLGKLTNTTKGSGLKQKVLAFRGDQTNGTFAQLRSSMQALRVPNKEIDAFMGKANAITDSIVEQLDSTIKEVDEFLHAARPVEGASADLELVERTRALIQSGKLKDATDMYRTLLQDKGISGMLLEAREVGAQFQHLNSELAERIMNAKSREEIVQVARDLEQASTLPAREHIASYVSNLNEMAKEDATLFQKSLMRATGDPVAEDELFVSIINRANSYKQLGGGGRIKGFESDGVYTGLAGYTGKYIKDTLPDVFGSIEKRFKAEFPDLDWNAGYLSTVLKIRLDDAITGRNFSAVDDLINKGFEWGGKKTGPIPELERVVAPLKELAKYVKASPGGEDVLKLAGWLAPRSTANFPYLRDIASATGLDANSSLFKNLRDLQRGPAGASPKTFTTTNKKGVTSHYTPESSRAVTLKDIHRRGSRAKQALFRGYAAKHGGAKPPDGYLDALVKDPRMDNEEFLRDIFRQAPVEEGAAQPSPLTKEELFRLRDDLAYAKLGGTVDEHVASLVRRMTEADSARHMFSMLSKMDSPGGRHPFITTDPNAQGLSLSDGTSKAYVPLRGPNGEKFPLQNLVVDQSGAGAGKELYVHPDLKEVLERHYLQGRNPLLADPKNASVVSALWDLIKQSKLLGSPIYFLTTMSGQLLKEANFSFANALGMVKAGQTAMKFNHEVQARALSSGLNFARHAEMVGAQAYNLSQPVKGWARRFLGWTKSLRGLDQSINKHTFESIRQAQLGAWMYKTRELFDTVGQELIAKGGYSADEAMKMVEQQASALINKRFATMHNTFMSQKGGEAFRRGSLASGLNESRLAHLTDSYYAVRDQYLGGGSKKRASFNTGIIDPTLREQYRKEAMVAMGISATSGLVFANVLSMLINGYSTFHNKPGKEDAVRLGDHYYKPSLFGFDNIIRRLATSVATPLVNAARRQAGDYRQQDLRGALQQATYGVTGVLHPGIQNLSGPIGGLETFDGRPIYDRSRGGLENVKRMAGAAVDHNLPIVSTLAGRDLMDGTPHNWHRRVSEGFGVGFVTPSNPYREHKTYAQSARIAMQQTMRQDIFNGLRIAYTKTGAEREELKRKVLLQAAKGAPVPKELQSQLGAVMHIQPSTIKTMIAELEGHSQVHLKRAPKTARATIAEHAGKYQSPELIRETFSEYK